MTRVSPALEPAIRLLQAHRRTVPGIGVESMDVCRNEKCKKPITYPTAPKVLKFAETMTLRVRCSHCGTINVKVVRNP